MYAVASAADVFSGLLISTLGVLIIVFREPFARMTVREQNRFWGFKFGESQVQISKVIAIIVGMGAFLIGLWTLVYALG
jgi:hypothetical protein